VIVADKEGTRLFEWLQDKINIPWSSDIRCIGRLREDLSIAGVVAYNCWLEESVFMHVALDPGAVSRQFLREAFRYPFVDCRKSRVYGLTPISLQRAIKFNRHLGFSPLYETKDFLLQVMNKEDCRWLNDAERSNGASAQSSLV